MALPSINKITGFDKRTHALICRECGDYEYAESIGLWNDDGDLIDALCGACEGKKGPIKKHMGFYNKLKSILNPIKDASNDEPKMETQRKLRLNCPLTHVPCGVGCISRLDDDDEINFDNCKCEGIAWCYAGWIEKKKCCDCDDTVKEPIPVECWGDDCDNIFCDGCAPTQCEDCDGTYCDDCEHLVECDDCLRLHCPTEECEECAEEEEEEDEKCKLCNKYECECQTEFSCNICNTDVITNIVNHEFKCDECREKDDDDEDDDAEWAECYGINTTKTKVYIMAGGGDHWWNYVVDFDDEHGEQLIVYKQDKGGMTEQYEKRLAYRHKDGVEELRLVPLDWQPAEDKDEGLLTY
tara:strand:- start:1024 stop:2085 length:1062 start_codon:yes stop_codon:yes gene_type:complete